MCSTHCPAEIDKEPVVQAMREEIIDNKRPVPEGIASLISNMRKGGNIFAAGREKRAEWAEGLDLPETAPTVYFAGCVASYKYPKIARSSAAILKAGGVDFTILGEKEWCCGNRAFQAGNVRMAKGMAEHNVKALEKIGAKEVVFSCAEGYHHFKKNYPGILGRELNFQVTHLAEYADRMIKAEKLRFGVQGNQGDVVYLDSCALGRKEGLYDEPRRVLDSLPGVTRGEMKRNRQASWCCGAGEGIVQAAHPKLSLAIAQDTLDELSNNDGAAIVTTCPTCKWNLEEGINMAHTQRNIYDLAEFVATFLDI